MNIIFLDAKSIGTDIDLSAFDTLGVVTKYDFTKDNELATRAPDADVLILNKTNINESTLGEAANVKLICVTGTGTNTLDKEFLKERNIPWTNVTNYSTNSVAQHTFAMLFYLLENLSYYDKYVRQGNYVDDTTFRHYENRFHELNNMTFGIIGLGNIGRRVASIASAFGAKVIYYSPSNSKEQEGYNKVDLDTLLKQSDIISIHAPLNQYTESLINKEALSKMKPSAILLNLGRGQIVVEEDLCEALENDEIAAAGLDVLAIEPMEANSPYLRLLHSNKLFLTPHIGWASVETRTNLMAIILNQIKEHFHLQ